MTVALSQRQEAPPRSEYESKLAGVDVALSTGDAAVMDAVVAAVHELALSPLYRERVWATAPELARAPAQPDFGLFTGFDFHVTEQGPKLIEINTNAGGAFFGARVDDERKALGVHGTKPLGHWSGLFVQQVLREWDRAGRGQLETIAIVDDAPDHQFLRLEFQMAKVALEQAGFRALILSPQQLAFREGILRHDNTTIDLVYNRLTSFALDRPEDRPLRDALVAGAAWITPGPRAHALLACKKNLVLMSNNAFLAETGISEKSRETLIGAVPETVMLSPQNQATLWENREHFYFKPLSGYGSRGVYAGSKITRKVWDAISKANYVAQCEVPASRIDTPDAGAMRVDIRNYAYEGSVFMRLARLYRGQTTNFRTPGGGFAPVVIGP